MCSDWPIGCVWTKLWTIMFRWFSVAGPKTSVTQWSITFLNKHVCSDSARVGFARPAGTSAAELEIGHRVYELQQVRLAVLDVVDDMVQQSRLIVRRFRVGDLVERLHFESISAMAQDSKSISAPQTILCTHPAPMRL